MLESWMDRQTAFDPIIKNLATESEILKAGNPQQHQSLDSTLVPNESNDLTRELFVYALGGLAPFV